MSLSRKSPERPLMDVVTTQIDSELLRTFIKTHSEEAFEALVRRHIDMVYASAMRQIKDPGMAEDITQAVFIILSRRAARIGNPHLLAGWLLHVTRYCAADARKIAARRRFHERRAALMDTAMELPELTHAEISEQLDAHLASLSAMDRTAIILRCLEERPLSEVAKELNISEEAAKKRINRALEKLRNNFSKTAVPPSIGLLTATLAKQSLSAPPALAAIICKAAAAKTASTATAALLTKGALKLMAYTTAKMIAVAAVGTFVIAATTVEVVHITQSTPATATTEVAVIAPDNTAPDTAPASAPQPAGGSFVYVLGKATHPGAYQIDARTHTPAQLLQRAGFDPEIQDKGWGTLIRRVGPNFQHTLTLPFSFFLKENTLPVKAREIQPNDVFNLEEKPPVPFPEPAFNGNVSILNDARFTQDYDVFGEYFSLSDLFTKLAGIPPDQLTDLVISIGRDTQFGRTHFFAQYKMADVLAGKSTYYLSPGEVLMVQTTRTAWSAKDITPLPKYPAPIPADKPSTPDGTYEVRGAIVRGGIFPFSNQTIMAAQVAVSFLRNRSDQLGAATLTRKVDGATEKIITLDLKAIIDGTAPDYILQDNDILEVHAKP